nr:MAG TPA: hypothetical protein [Caudoviricetes sp.]
MSPTGTAVITSSLSESSPLYLSLIFVYFLQLF